MPRKETPGTGLSSPNAELRGSIPNLKTNGQTPLALPSTHSLWKREALTHSAATAAPPTLTGREKVPFSSEITLRL